MRSGLRDERVDRVVWHDAENASYAADLPVWRSLAAQAGGPVLDLGCGTGRVALDLARRGSHVTGIDVDGVLVEELNARARASDLDAVARTGDIRALEVEGEFSLVIVPMQTIQLLDGPEERVAALAGAGARLGPGGLVAVAVVEGDLGAGAPGFELAQPLPDVIEADGWVYSSLPVSMEIRDGRIVVSRLRQMVATDGDLTEELAEVALAVTGAAELEAEAREAGLGPAGRIQVSETDSHVGSCIVLLEVAS